MTESPGIAEIRDAIRSRQASAEEICRAALDRIHSVNAQLNAFNTVDADRALARARAVDGGVSSDAPLAGVPVALKDNLCVRGMRTTASSTILDRFRPPYDATVVERLEAAGAIVVGKTNAPEFGLDCPFG